MSHAQLVQHLDTLGEPNDPADRVEFFQRSISLNPRRHRLHVEPSLVCLATGRLALRE